MNGMPYHSTGITRHVTSGYLRFHPMLTISLFVVALLSAMLPVVALNSLDLYVQAAKEGAAGQSGGYTYQISGGSNDVAEELRQQVQNGKAIGVKSTQGSVGLTSASGSSRNTIADITFLTGPSRYGTLIEGHQPSQKNEISLSRAAAEQIDAQLGDMVTVQCTIPHYQATISSLASPSMLRTPTPCTQQQCLPKTISKTYKCGSPTMTLL